MKNPWTTKNPFMSLWLSGANKVANAARGQATAAVKRETQTAVKQGTRNWFDFWTGAAKIPAAAAPAAAAKTPTVAAKTPAAAAGAASPVGRAAKAGRKTATRKPARKTAKTAARKAR